MNVSDSFGTINTPEKEKEKEKIALGLQKRKKNGSWGGKLEGTLICKSAGTMTTKKTREKYKKKPNSRIQVLS